MKITIDISPETLRAVNMFASKDGTRYTLNGVFLNVISKTEYQLVATDGRMLFAIRETCAEVSGFKDSISAIIPSTLIEHLKSGNKKRRRYASISIETEQNDSAVTINDITSGVAFTQKAIDGFYPKTHDVVPKGLMKRAAINAFNAEFINRFYTVAKLLSGRPMPGIALYQAEENGVFWVESDGWGDRQVIALLMPLRAEFPETITAPAWLQDTDYSKTK